MRVGVDATAIFSDRPTGLGIYSVNIINELARIHDDLVVWTVSDSMLSLDASNVRRVMQPFKFLGEGLYRLRPFWVQNALPKQIRAENIDVLYTTVPSGLIHSPVPHVLTVHDIIPLLSPEDSPLPVRWNFRYRLPKIFKRAAAIVADSRHTRHDLMAHYGLGKEQISVVELGYDKDNFCAPDDFSLLRDYGLDRGRYVLYVGSCGPRKNLTRLIEAFARVCSGTYHDLVLAGGKTPSQVKHLQGVAARLGVRDRVKLIDYVPYEHLPVFYGGAALFVYLSEYEGFGLPVLEAMACGAPVLASSATSIPEVAGDAAVLVDPCDTDLIALKMAEILVSREAQSDLRQRGFARCKAFSWERAARELLDILGHCAVK